MSGMEIIKARGTHFEIGAQIGEYLAGGLPEVIAGNEELRHKFLPFHRTAAGQALYERLLDLNGTLYPDYIEEIKGMAEGGGVPFDIMFVSSMRGEYRAYVEAAQKTDDKGCGTYSALDETKAFFAHNEDGRKVFRGNLYLLQAEPAGKPSFTALIYPSFICGNGIGFNSEGICYAINHVRPQNVREGVGRPFIARSLLEAASIDDAVGRVTVPDRASGFNYTIGSVRERRIVNVEVSPDKHFVLEIKGRDYHANYYNELRGEVAQDHDDTSIERIKRIRELEVEKMPETPKDVLMMLSDRKHPDYPVHRHATAKDPFTTLATVLFDLDAGTLEIYRTRPSENPEGGMKFEM